MYKNTCYNFLEHVLSDQLPKSKDSQFTIKYDTEKLPTSEIFFV